MGLEEKTEIKEIRESLKELTEARELNVKEAIKTIHQISEKYKVILKKKGTLYCSKYYSDIPKTINALIEELTGGKTETNKYISFL